MGVLGAPVTEFIGRFSVLLVDRITARSSKLESESSSSVLLIIRFEASLLDATSKGVASLLLGWNSVSWLMVEGGGDKLDVFDADGLSDFDRDDFDCPISLCRAGGGRGSTAFAVLVGVRRVGGGPSTSCAEVFGGGGGAFLKKSNNDLFVAGGITCMLQGSGMFRRA